MKTYDFKKNNSVVIVTTAFYPENAIGAVRLTYLAKNLSSFYKKIIIICPSEKNINNIDPTLDISDIPNIYIYRIKNFYFFNIIQFFRDKFLSGSKGSEYIGSKNNSNRSHSFVKIFISNIFLSFYTHAKNINFFLKSFFIFKSLSRKHTFDILISSYPSYSSHLAALFIKKQIPKIFWVADFRDPMVYPSLGAPKLLSYIQKKSVKNADLITVISHGVKDMISQKTKNENIKVLYNGFDKIPKLQKTQILNKEKINFTYVGSLYSGKRDVSIFFNFLYRFLENNKNFKNLIKINYAGTDFVSLEKIAAQHKLEKHIINHGKVNRMLSIQMQYESDFILIATWNNINEEGILTGKLFEALMLNKKIIATICGNKKNSELKKLIESLSIGVALESNFVNEKDYENFCNLILSNHEDELSYEQLNSNHPFKDFSYKNLTKKLVHYINNSR